MQRVLYFSTTSLSCKMPSLICCTTMLVGSNSYSMSSVLIAIIFLLHDFAACLIRFLSCSLRGPKGTAKLQTREQRDERVQMELPKQELATLRESLERDEGAEDDSLSCSKIIIARLPPAREPEEGIGLIVFTRELPLPAPSKQQAH